ncbi:hypothetical protein PUNSTDRAFT_92068 [Punctularia strigosozonata HHB-11173 SS5]|uniref:GST C-terminal domain-containing protein n=1 Tax=Punctularia strigosozonata (strain HHB-11173) TaxID=741275 RepID=R7S480_PUNST|nr:uncharacterized protein PUNSTDRAFT_92068 [Punctularia strigosozonata HHB-11173 SS5]EIN05185.1 hypothetical protein PUNSTDRAFT_92068 [Punctularia strigosozonata HHB-11173 SS5]
MSNTDSKTASVVIHGFSKPSANIPSASGYCQKLETFLRAVGSPSYELADAVPFTAPKGKLPWATITTPGSSQVIPDSHYIVRHLIASGLSPDPDASLTPAERADSRAWQAWVEELVYPAVVSTRWLRPANYAIVKHELSAPAPVKPVIAWIIYRRIKTGLTGHGVARHSDEEVDVLLKEYVDALDARLSAAKSEFFHGGEEPTMVDIVTWSFLVNSLALQSNPEFNVLILGKPRLMRYVVALAKKWFPEYESIIKLGT